MSDTFVGDFGIGYYFFLIAVTAVTSYYSENLNSFLDEPLGVFRISLFLPIGDLDYFDFSTGLSIFSTN